MKIMKIKKFWFVLAAVLLGADCNTQNDGWLGLGDEDRDLYLSDVDCNDDDPRVFPGAPEHCTDGVDNDCDEVIDTDPEWCTDVDEDGYLERNTGSSRETDDCDDNDAAVNPGAPELCDGIDNDCDEQVDEEDVCGRAA